MQHNTRCAGLIGGYAWATAATHREHWCERCQQRTVHQYLEEQAQDIPVQRTLCTDCGYSQLCVRSVKGTPSAFPCGSVVSDPHVIAQVQHYHAQGLLDG